MNEILTFFRTIIAKFFARDTFCEKLSNIAGQIFDWERHLHTKVLQNYNSQETLSFDHEISLNTKRVESESEWRLNTLAVGDRVDVVK